MRVAIIGRGFGSYAMNPAFAARGWEVDLVSSRDDAAVRAAIAEPVDLVAVHSPPFQHREHVLAAIAAGRDVLCDKPFGANADDARTMRDAARAAGVLDFLNFEFRFAPARLKVVELARSGAVGRLRHVSLTSFMGLLRGRDHGWLNDAELAGGWLGALGSHQIDMVRWVSGSEVADCGGVLRIDVEERGDGAGGTVRSTADDAFAIWLAMADGATASLDAAAGLPGGTPPRMLFLGDAGTIEVVGDVVTLIRPKEDNQVFDFTPAPGGFPFPALDPWIAAIEGALRDRRRIAPNFDDGLATAEVMQRLRRAG